MDEFRKDGVDLPAPPIGEEPLSDQQDDEAAEDDASAGKK